MIKKIASAVICSTMLLGMSGNVFAAENLDTTASQSNIDLEIVESYNSIIDYAQNNNISLGLSLDTFIEEYELGNYTDINDYMTAYYDLLDVPDANSPAPYSSGDKKWYYNTGTTLPQKPNYSQYNLLSSVKKGDIIFEANGGFGITGHIAIVEGIYYNSTLKTNYIRIVEAIDDGVVRSILDDERVNDKDVTVLRVSSATSSNITEAVKFCVGQLGKTYNLDLAKDTSASESDWYCSELVWAGYYNQGINIETTSGINEPGVTPRDIRNGNKTSVVSFK